MLPPLLMMTLCVWGCGGWQQHSGVQWCDLGALHFKGTTCLPFSAYTSGALPPFYTHTHTDPHTPGETPTRHTHTRTHTRAPGQAPALHTHTHTHTHTHLASG